jgi:transposase
VRFPRATYLPLHRQSEIYAREGVDLERSTLADWVGSASALLQPLNEALRKHVMRAAKLHADDTPVPVLEPGKERTKTGRLWTYVCDERPAGHTTAPAVWFAYTPDRRANIRCSIWQTSRARCKRMRTLASTDCTTAAM